VTTKKKTKPRLINTGTITKLGAMTAHKLIPKIVAMADARGISFPLEYSNTDIIKEMGVEALRKAKYNEVFKP
jgi:hypothetical protein